MKSSNRIKGLSITGLAIYTLIALVSEYLLGIKILKESKITYAQVVVDFFINPEVGYDLDRRVPIQKDTDEVILEYKLIEEAKNKILLAPFNPLTIDIQTPRFKC